MVLNLKNKKSFLVGNSDGSYMLRTTAVPPPLSHHFLSCFLFFMPFQSEIHLGRSWSPENVPAAMLSCSYPSGRPVQGVPLLVRSLCTCSGMSRCRLWMDSGYSLCVLISSPGFSPIFFARGHTSTMEDMDWSLEISVSRSPMEAKASHH